jgi:uncharacterized protein (TIGR02284 family)
MSENEKVISTLNSLIETCKDGEQGFRTAAEALTDFEVKGLFERYTAERARMVSELQAEVRRLGGDPERGGSVAASMHRGWINIKSVVTGKDDARIIAEAERGEDVAKQEYEKALQSSLPAPVHALVQGQYGQVKEAHDRVRELERRFTKA